MSAVFDRLRRSKWAYVASGWSAFLDNMAKNPDIAEVIKNDRDFFAHNEAVQRAKDVGKLRRAIKAAIGRAGVIAYMEQTKNDLRREKTDDKTEQQWSWQDFTSKVIDAGLQIPKEERHMWILNCTSLKKGEKIKLPGTKEEYEVLAVQSGEAKIAGPPNGLLGNRISSSSEVLVWRPGSQFAERVIEPSADRSASRNMQVVGETGVRTISHEELQVIKAKKENDSTKGETEMVKSRTSVTAALKREIEKINKASRKVDPEPETETENRWRKNDGDVPFRFGMPVRRGKMVGKVIRTHGSKMRVRLDNDEGAVDWSTEDETIYWKDPIQVQDEDEPEETEPVRKPAVRKEKEKEQREQEKPKSKGKPTPEPEPFDEGEDEEEEEEIEIEEDEDEGDGEDDGDEDEDDEEGEDDDDDEIDPDDLPDDDADLLMTVYEDEDGNEIEQPVSRDDDEDEDDSVDEDEGEDDSDDPDDGGEGEVEGDDDKEYTYNGNDIAELAGVDYQRVQRLKAQGVLDGTWLPAPNGRIMYTFDAVDLVKNAPRNKPGRPPGGGKKRDTVPPTPPAPAGGKKPGRPAAAPPATIAKREEPLVVTSKRKEPDPVQQTIAEVARLNVTTPTVPTAPTSKSAEPENIGVVRRAAESEKSSSNWTVADIFLDTINELACRIEQRQEELVELQRAKEVLEGLARRNR